MKKKIHFFRLIWLNFWNARLFLNFFFSNCSQLKKKPLTKPTKSNEFNLFFFVFFLHFSIVFEMFCKKKKNKKKFGHFCTRIIWVRRIIWTFEQQFSLNGLCFFMLIGMLHPIKLEYITLDWFCVLIRVFFTSIFFYFSNFLFRDLFYYLVGYVINFI